MRRFLPLGRTGFETVLIMLAAFTFLTANVKAGEIPTLLPTPSGVKSITPADFEPIKNPVMRWAQGDFAKDPSVVRFHDVYYLYYSYFLESNGKKILTIGVAQSDDRTHWRFEKNILPMQECDKNGLGAPCAKIFNGKIWLFYQTYGNGANDAICCAWSDDGLNFTPHEENPIFRPTGDWTNGRAIDAEVTEFRGKIFLYAATRDRDGKIQKLVAATADAQSGFGKNAWTQAADFSIQEPLLAWETRCIEAPTSVVKNDRLYLFYAGGYNCAPQQIGVAASDDGIHFTRLGDVPFVPTGPAGQWNASESGHPGLFVDDDGSTWLFYQGNASNGKDWFLSRLRIEWDASPDVPKFSQSPNTNKSKQPFMIPRIGMETPHDGK